MEVGTGAAMAGVRLRRTPVQGRSQARVQRMLAAAAALVEEDGVEAVTTSRIAERAGVSVGSLYQFFPDKTSILDALVLRYSDAFRQLVERVAATGTFNDWREAVAATLDAYFDFYRSEPGFRALWYGYVRADLRAADKAANVLLARVTRDLVEQRFGVTPRGDGDLAFEIAVELGGAMLDLAFRRDPRGDERVIAEAKTIVTEHLARHLGPPRPRKP
jgi:AcrR family transcriptional regulator